MMPVHRIVSAIGLRHINQTPPGVHIRLAHNMGLQPKERGILSQESNHLSFASVPTNDTATPYQQLLMTGPSSLGQI